MRPKRYRSVHRHGGGEILGQHLSFCSLFFGPSSHRRKPNAHHFPRGATQGLITLLRVFYAAHAVLSVLLCVYMMVLVTGSEDV